MTQKSARAENLRLSLIARTDDCVTRIKAHEAAAQDHLINERHEAADTELDLLRASCFHLWQALGPLLAVTPDWQERMR
jgi:hypothetical protein